MHIGKRLARLNPANCRFDIGSGGIPEFTTTDIAAALAYVTDGIGRELLCRVWWPDGARLAANGLRDAVDQVMRKEWARRETVMLDGLLAVASGGSRGHTAFADGHAQRWPRMVIRTRGIAGLAGSYAKVREAVLIEISSAGLCPQCAGRMSALNDVGVIVSCPTCDGTGHHRLSDRERAESCGLSSTTFREGWSSVYDWTFQMCMDEIQRAERQFNNSLGG